jgi:hypothetical protein
VKLKIMGVVVIQISVKCISHSAVTLQVEVLEKVYLRYIRSLSFALIHVLQFVCIHLLWLNWTHAILKQYKSFCKEVEIFSHLCLLFTIMNTLCDKFTIVT